MKIAEYDYNVEVNQVSAQHYEVRKDNRVVWESEWKNWGHDENRQGAIYEAQRQVEKARMVEEIEKAWEQD